MTQIEEIRDIFDNSGRHRLFDIEEIERISELPRPSIRRVLSHLTRHGSIERVERGLYRRGGDLVEFRQKFVSGLFYCGGQKRQYFGITFEPNEIVREEELIQEIEHAFGHCSDMRENHGYSSDIFEGEVPRGERYPNIGVGEL